MGTDNGVSLGRAFAIYTALRLLLFAGAFAVLTLIDVQGLVAIALALLVSSLLSLLLLRQQREELGAALLARNDRRAREKARLRSMLDESDAG